MSSAQFPNDGSKNYATASAYPLMGYNKPSPHGSISPLGKPSTKPLVPGTHVLAVAISFLGLILGTISILPNFRIAWYLGTSYQLILIGFLLSVMNLCLQAILPYTFLLFEARFGQSRLQNFDAIIRGKLDSPNMTFIWRGIILLFLALPIILSALYKRAIGGMSSSETHLPVLYGIDFPKTGNWAPPNDPIYFLTASMGAFLSASQYNPQAYPSDDEFPLAYGYNTVLLSNGSAAILDIPTDSYISAPQAKLKAGEGYEIHAQVGAYLATVDESSDFRTNDATWNADISTLETTYLYEGDGARIGMMPIGTENNQMYFGLYYNSSYYGGTAVINDPADRDLEQFRLSALRFDLKRTQCQGHWRVTASSLVLEDATCDVNQLVNSSILQAPNMGPYADDILPTTQHIYGGFLGTTNSPENKLTDFAWLNATHSVTVVSLYWARALYILSGSGTGELTKNYSVPYLSPDQTILSTRSTLTASPLLFIVLALQPLITLAALAATIWLYDVPLGTRFGMIAVLSGFQASSSRPLAGAGLSGELTGPVRLEVTSTVLEEDGEDDGDGDGRVTYRVLDVGKIGVEDRLQKGKKYW